MMSEVLFCTLVAVALGLSNAATVRIEPEVRELLIAEGYTLKMKCIFEGNSSNYDQILWIVPYHNNKEFPRTEKMNSDGTYTTTMELTIEKFRDDQAGSYKCMLLPNDGSSFKQTEIMVKLVIENKPQPVYSFGQDTTMLFCNTSLGQDAKMVGWFKGDKPIEKGQKYTLYKNGSLGIMDLDRDDAGLYKLRFELNTSRTYDCVIKFRAGPLVLDMDKSINGEEEGSVEIKCEVKGWPRPKVTWLKNKKEITPNGNTITFSEHQNVQDAKLTLTNLQYDQEGMYTCRAYTKDFFNQTSEKSIKLWVKSKFEWLWPLLGILAGAIVLVLLIFLFEKLKKKQERRVSSQEPVVLGQPEQPEQPSPREVAE